MVDDAATLFKALSDPLRLRILHVLRSGELCVGDIVAILRVPQPTASRHLTALKQLGLVTTRKNSYWTFYRVAPPKTSLRRKLLACLSADVGGRARDRKRVRAIRQAGSRGPA